MRPAWVPTSRELPGICLSVALGALAWWLASFLGTWFPALSDVVVAIAVGALIINSPLAKVFALASPDARDTDLYERGLRFTGKWVLRLAIMLMGLKIQVGLFQSDQVMVIGCVLACALPSVFFVVQSINHFMGLRREMGDLLAIGTMICGASAINALAPVLVARRHEQGLSISVIFVFSIVALFGFAPLAQYLGIEGEMAGLWAGLAVNDLSSAVAVGSQFGDASEVVATAAKSFRIILLGPILIFFGFIRTPGTERNTSKEPGLLSHFPRFILGYFFCFALRILGDGYWENNEEWSAFLAFNSGIVKLLILSVCAGIGLQVQVKTLVNTGGKTLVVGAAGAFTIMGVTLAMLLAFQAERPGLALGVGGTVFLTTLFMYLSSTRGDRRYKPVLQRLEAGSRLSIREAISALSYWDGHGGPQPDKLQKLMESLSPAIGEIQPLRTLPVSESIEYKRMTYWESANGQGSLVGLLWPPGIKGHIHSHGNDCISKTIEGELHVTHFSQKSDTELIRNQQVVLKPGQLSTMEASDTLHALANLGRRDAIHIHFYGPDLSEQGKRFELRGEESLDEFVQGDSLPVRMTKDRLPRTLFKE